MSCLCITLCVVRWWSLVVLYWLPVCHNDLWQFNTFIWRIRSDQNLFKNKPDVCVCVYTYSSLPDTHDTVYGHNTQYNLCYTNTHPRRDFNDIIKKKLLPYSEKVVLSFSDSIEFAEMFCCLKQHLVMLLNRSSHLFWSVNDSILCLCVWDRERESCVAQSDEQTH